MKTDYWKALLIMKQEIKGSEISLKDSPIVMPKGVEEVVREN